MYYKLSELANVLNEMATQILCVSEHWLKSEQLAISNITGCKCTTIFCRQQFSHGGVVIYVKSEQLAISNITGYKCTTIFCRQQFSHGGVVIYVKNGYITHQELDLSDLVNEKVFEAVCILCDNLAVICLYRSPSGDINEFCDKLDQCIQRVSSKKKTTNILNYKSATDLNGKNLVNILQENGLYTITNSSTRVTNTSKSAIDHIITNIDCKKYESKCNIETGLSDHFMQCTSVTNVPISKPVT
ncbi:Nicotinamide/nicotinic acid mononucleotide adenylyltransferase 2 [Frankliniella fusca]|uniref:Nicotinamide/nicotinic acid mononucleotide adenylyltransferase 2 n=1 Tax=Frankliniella fusca TaxID=407009 RepID=A0AAE1LHM7_9NEOP|nr:Nicotinamide/nicotinic acid mononucleotide adenylyltransferase 2 [Frankliniella fusca]